MHILSQSGGSSRLGLVVRRAVGNAVIRNRAKRRLREVFRRIKGHLTKTVDLVVRAQNSIRDATYWEIKEELTRLLQNERLLPRTLPDTETNGLQKDHIPAQSSSDPSERSSTGIDSNAGTSGGPRAETV